MTSWRDTASPQAQADLDGLLNPAVGFAQQQLEKRGEFHPYAVAVRADGETEMVDASLAVDNSLDMVAVLWEALAHRRDGIRAVAVVADVRVVSDGGDAIGAEIEHAEGTALKLVLPYKKKRFGRGVEFGELRVSAGTRHIWVD